MRVWPWMVVLLLATMGAGAAPATPKPSSAPVGHRGQAVLGAEQVAARWVQGDSGTAARWMVVHGILRVRGIHRLRFDAVLVDSNGGTSLMGEPRSWPPHRSSVPIADLTAGRSGRVPFELWFHDENPGRRGPPYRFRLDGSVFVPSSDRTFGFSAPVPVDEPAPGADRILSVTHEIGTDRVLTRAEVVPGTGDPREIRVEIYANGCSWGTGMERIGRGIAGRREVVVIASARAKGLPVVARTPETILVEVVGTGGSSALWRSVPR